MADALLDTLLRGESRTRVSISSGISQNPADLFEDRNVVDVGRRLVTVKRGIF